MRGPLGAPMKTVKRESIIDQWRRLEQTAKEYRESKEALVEMQARVEVLRKELHDQGIEYCDQLKLLDKEGLE